MGLAAEKYDQDLGYEEIRGMAIEVLRCAADLLVSGRSFFPVIDAHHRLYGMKLNSEVRELVDAVREHVGGARDQYLLLEAAQRLEEGSYP